MNVTLKNNEYRIPGAEQLAQSPEARAPLEPLATIKASDPEYRLVAPDVQRLADMAQAQARLNRQTPDAAEAPVPPEYAGRLSARIGEMIQHYREAATQPN